MAAKKESQEQSERQIPDRWNDGPWNEIASLTLFALGFVILLSLVSYSANDPSFNTANGEKEIHNWVGSLGANVSNFLLQAFGLAALFVPFGLFLGGWWQWHENMPKLPAAKILGVLLIFISMTGILTFIDLYPENRSFYLGGFIGRWLVFGPVIGLREFLGLVGTIFALMLLLMIGVVVSTQISIVGALVGLAPGEQRAGAGRSLGSLLRRTGAESAEEEIEEEIPEFSADSAGDDGADRHQTARTEPPARVIRPRTEEKTARTAPVEEPEEPESAEAAAEEAPARPAVAGPAGGRQMGNSSASTLSGSTATRRRKAAEIIEPAAPSPASHEDGDTLDDDLPFALPPQRRTVDEMISSISVRRQEPVEAPAAPAATATRKPVVPRPSMEYRLPSTEMLTPPAPRSEMEEAELIDRARQLAEKCNEFNVSGQVMQISPGPVVTTFEFKPDPGVKYSRITSLVDDLCLALKAESIRIDRIPGKSTVGIEVPNVNREMIRLREVIESKKFDDNPSRLTFAIGKTIDGSNHAADLARMPHLLIAGATGAGKSVMLNAILVSLLYKSTPDEVKMILVDPKRLELGLYADIPHLLTPIVTDPKRASNALKWAVSEMENRYKHLAMFGVRNIDQYNREVCPEPGRRRTGEENEDPKPLPYIVVVIDELADLMMVSARDVEESITRLAQMARAVGIHLVLATQRPSVDVITGLIKANFPSRISFRVSSKVDSRTIIDTNGAEQLLGQGDMLFLPPGTSRLLRVHGAYVDEKEVKRICDFVRSQANPNYDEKVVMSEKEAEGAEGGDFVRDEKYDDALRVVLQNGKASTSLLQRTLRIGYGRAASIIDMMHREGIVGPEDGSKPRQVLMKPDFLERLEQLREE